MQRIKQSLPNPQRLAMHPWLKPLSHRLLEPGLWHVRHEAVARGAAIGIFWAFAVPFGQFLFATAHCVWWRGNIPVATGLTLITNPFTLAFWLWMAYKVGGTLLGAPGPGPNLEPMVSRGGGNHGLDYQLRCTGGFGHGFVRYGWRGIGVHHGEAGLASAYLVQTPIPFMNGAAKSLTLPDN